MASSARQRRSCERELGQLHRLGQSKPGGATRQLRLLNCCGFGVEVEQARLGIPTERPLAVPQWNGVIAVNCAAIAAGGFWWERVSECQG
ncbi:hypothetical protein M758_11G073400 [Ceratodon purpureus]|nr:hypothetical protein M758_11G073400 [Ceratodon purpureus]